jgi:hypothetical protein
MQNLDVEIHVIHSIYTNEMSILCFTSFIILMPNQKMKAEHGFDLWTSDEPQHTPNCATLSAYEIEPKLLFPLLFSLGHLLKFIKVLIDKVLPGISI